MDEIGRDIEYPCGDVRFAIDDCVEPIECVVEQARDYRRRAIQQNGRCVCQPIAEHVIALECGQFVGAVYDRCKYTGDGVHKVRGPVNGHRDLLGGGRR